MAVALKDVEKKEMEKNLRLVPQTKTERVEYEFPYDDLYLLYDAVMEEMEKK